MGAHIIYVMTVSYPDVKCQIFSIQYIGRLSNLAKDYVRPELVQLLILFFNPSQKDWVTTHHPFVQVKNSCL